MSHPVQLQTVTPQRLILQFPSPLSSPAPREARAIDQPCQLYTYHSPQPSRTQGHHQHPVYLQNRVWGGIRDNDLIWVCGICHDNVHEWLGYLLGETRLPSPEPGRLAKAEARRTLDWYLAELAKL